METWKVSCFAKKYFRKLGKLITLEKIGARSAPKKIGFLVPFAGEKAIFVYKNGPKNMGQIISKSCKVNNPGMRNFRKLGKLVVT